MTNEKCTSHTLFERVAKGLWKGCVCERWVGDWTDCNILTPSSSDYSSTSFLILLGCSTGGPEGPAFCWELVLTASNCNSNFNCNWHQLTQLSVAPGYIIVWHLPASCERRICIEFNPSTLRLYLDIFDRMHSFLDWQLDRRSKCNITSNLSNCFTSHYCPLKRH